MGLREAILEANESERDKEQDWRTIAKRSSSWFLFILSLIGSAYCVVLVVDRSDGVNFLLIRMFSSDQTNLKRISPFGDRMRLPSP